MMFDQKLFARMMPKVRIEPSGCWVWTGYLHPFGYGMIAVVLPGRKKATNMNSHRAMWRALHGELTRDQFVCHKCDNPPCCNPEHLFIGSIADNNRDMADKGRYNHQQKTHCVRGHEFTEENTYHSPSNPKKRQCKECQRTRQRMAWRGEKLPKIYDGSVRRGPKKYRKRPALPQDDAR